MLSNLVKLSLLIYLAVQLSFCTDYHEETIIPAKQIRFVTSPNSILVTRNNADDGKKPIGISSLYGREIADRQARVWDDEASLIFVHEKMRSSQFPKEGILVWLYIYTNRTGGAWLGVTVDSKGLVDAGQNRQSSINNLSGWKTLQKWDIDIIEIPDIVNEDGNTLLNATSVKLLANIYDDSIYWIVKYQLTPFGSVRYFDAKTGEEISTEGFDRVFMAPIETFFLVH